MLPLSAVLLFCWHFLVSGDVGAPFSLINRVQTDCEWSSTTFGTRLADSFNSLDEETRGERQHHDYLVEHLGFANHSGLWRQTEVSANGHPIPNLQKRGGWIGHKNVSHSSYWALDNKWVYMVGDMTQAQLWSAMVSPHHGADFAAHNVSEYVNSDKCTKQGHRTTKTEADQHHSEATCTSHGFGAEGKITFDWKHSPFDTYDEWLWGESGPWSCDPAVIRPDILVLQVGLHTCLHSVLPNNDQDSAMVEAHEKALPQLFAAIKTAVARPRSDKREPTTVIISTSSRLLEGDSALAAIKREDDPRYSHCVWRLNRVIANEAHQKGFAVFEREELEHRLFFKSEHVPEDIRATNASTHLAAPAPQIVATTLLNMISCLAINGSNPNRVVDATRHHHHHPGHHWGAVGSNE